MTMLDYPELLAMVDELITDNGQQCTFQRNARAAGNPTEPWRGPAAGTPVAPTIISAIAVIVPSMDKDDPEAMRRGEATAYVAPDNFGAGTPFAEAAMEGFDTMTDAAGEVWRVLDVERVQPGNINLLFIITIKH